MNLEEIIKVLRKEQQDIDQAILALETLSAGTTRKKMEALPKRSAADGLEGIQALAGSVSRGE